MYIGFDFYLRKFSTSIRQWKWGSETMIEDPVVAFHSQTKEAMMILTCRNRQRVFQQAWNRWVRNTGIQHDYTTDVRAILSRRIEINDLRSELEVEVLYKWAVKNSGKLSVSVVVFIV